MAGISVAFSWISAFIGLMVRSVEAAQSGGFIWLFPLTFASSAFVPVASMPTWLQAFARHNPVTVLANSLRGLFHVDPSLTAADTRWALIQSVAWIVGILIVFIPISVLASTARPSGTRPRSGMSISPEDVRRLSRVGSKPELNAQSQRRT